MNKKLFEKNIEKKCDVCKKNFLVGQYGIRKCEHCGWYNSEMNIERAYDVIYPNLIPYNKALILAKEGKPYISSIEDFLGGLFFYSEMQFDFEGRHFDVFLTGGEENDDIEFGDSPENVQTYKSKEEFMQKAHIDGRLLRDIWDRVENASYM